MTNKNAFKLLGLTLVLLMVLSAPISAAAPAPSVQGGDFFVEGEVLLKVGPGVSASAVARTVGGTVQRSIGDGSIQLVKVRAGSVPAAVQALNGRGGVAFAEPNWLRQLHDAPNDLGYGLKWDLNNEATLCDGTDCADADADMDWQEAYTYLGSNFNGSAVVAVIDTGIDLNHPDLDGKLVAGYDYLDGDNDPTDTYGHGTHVAGIVLAETNNAAGTAGVAYSNNIKVMPLRVCDASGCPTDAIVNAIYHAADQGANVINMSLGGRFGSSAEEAAINYAWGKGLVITASSGNDGSRRLVSYPAAFANCIAVGSTNWHDALAPYSNQGSALDVVAPGGDMSSLHDPGGIYSTMPTYNVYLTTAYGYSDTYDQLQGTSMAAPQVAGLAGLVFAMGKTNTEVRAIIEETVDDLGATGWDKSFGWGRVNVYNAVLEAGGGGGENQPPSANFSYTTSDLTAYFTDTSADPDGTITSWSWTFGDGATSTAQNPSHTYASDGTYSVTLTVTDDGEATGSTSQSVTVGSGGGSETVTVASLTGTSSTVNKNFWRATVTATIDPALAGAVVSGAWDGGSTVTCTTGSEGHCEISTNVRATTSSTTFAVTDVALAGYEYVPGSTTSVTINKP